MASPLRGIPLRYRAVSTSDSLDSTEDFPGAMSSLRNLMPAPSTKNYWICRPAIVERAASADFAAVGITAAGFISASLVVGDRVYGMIASDAVGAGFDVPFCYDLTTDALVTITGPLAANCPTSPATTGDWTPPTMDLIGTTIVVTHPGFDGAGARFFGVINVSNPAAPTWTCQNTVTNLLPAVPVAVKNFNGRAWYLVNPATGQPAAYFSDALVAGTVTNADQILTFDDNLRLTALGLLGLGAPLTGGVSQALIVFKGSSGMFQVTGDRADGTLSKNAISVPTGTDAPLSITPTSKGLAFMSSQGFRVLDFAAQVSDPIGGEGYGVSVPFIYAKHPSRVCAASNADVLRATVENTSGALDEWQEWWFHFSRQVWSGPHTCAASQIQRWRKDFVMAPEGQTALIASSTTIPSDTSTFVELGVQLTWEYQTAFLPDPSQMSMMSMVETTINIAYTEDAGNVTVSALDEDDAVILSYLFPAVAPLSKWGAFTWGAAPWLGSRAALRPRQVAWSKPVVFRRMKLSIEGDSANDVVLGDWFMRYDMLGYLTDEFA